MEIEHIIPEVLGGATEADNLWLACSACNEHKSGRIAGIDPESGEEVRLFDPRYQVWREHFRWSSEGDRIEGLTSAGRATVATLHLNRMPLVHSRQRWVAVGWHPPDDWLAMTAPCSYYMPAVIIQAFEHVLDFHTNSVRGN